MSSWALSWCCAGLAFRSRHASHRDCLRRLYRGDRGRRRRVDPGGHGLLQRTVIHNEAINSTVPRLLRADCRRRCRSHPARTRGSRSGRGSSRLGAAGARCNVCCECLRHLAGPAEMGREPIRTQDVDGAIRSAIAEPRVRLGNPRAEPRRCSGQPTAGRGRAWIGSCVGRRLVGDLCALSLLVDDVEVEAERAVGVAREQRRGRRRLQEELRERSYEIPQ